MAEGGGDDGSGGGEGDGEATALDGGEAWGVREQEGGDEVAEEDE